MVENILQRCIYYDSNIRKGNLLKKSQISAQNWQKAWLNHTQELPEPQEHHKADGNNFLTITSTSLCYGKRFFTCNLPKNAHTGCNRVLSNRSIKRWMGTKCIPTAGTKSHLGLCKQPPCKRNFIKDEDNGQRGKVMSKRNRSYLTLLGTPLRNYEKKLHSQTWYIGPSFSYFSPL